MNADTLPTLLDPVVINVASYDPILVYTLGGVVLLYCIFNAFLIARAHMS